MSSLSITGIDIAVPGGWGHCYRCGAQMIQGGDHDDVDADGVEIIISNFHCPNCESSCEFAWLVSWDMDNADDADATEPSPGASEAKTAVLTYGAVQQELARVRKQAEELASAKGRLAREATEHRVRRQLAEKILRKLAMPQQRVSPLRHQRWVRSTIAAFFAGDIHGASRRADHPRATGACSHCDINLYDGRVPHPKAMPCNVPGCPYEKERDQLTDHILLSLAR